MKALTPEQARAVLAAVESDPLRALWTLTLTTGLRQGELLALRWQDVDLDAGRHADTPNTVRLTKRAHPARGHQRRAVAR
jgi:integrase